VSLKDYENFALTFAGIGKAQVVAFRFGEKQIVHITIASASGEEVDPSSALFSNLVKAIDNVREPWQEVRVGSFQLTYFNLSAKIQVDPQYPVEVILSDVEKVLLDTFSFEKRIFGQDVTAAEVVTVIQKVAGVIATDLDKLYLATDEEGAERTRQETILTAEIARVENSTVLPAQLLIINPAGITLENLEVNS